MCIYIYIYIYTYICIRMDVNTCEELRVQSGGVNDRIRL